LTTNQALYLFALAFLVTVVAIGGTFLSSGYFVVLFVAASALVSLFKDRITPTDPAPPSPMQILEGSRLWKAVAIIYAILVVAVVAWHLLVSRLAVFDNMTLPIGLLLLLGSAMGPIVKHVIFTYRLLGAESAAE
jgi:hypothetical protein